MKAVKTQSVITSLRSLTDGGLSLTVHTPELSPKEKAYFMELQGLNLNALFDPMEHRVPEIKINSEFEGKSPSQRLRAVLFVQWAQEGKQGEFAQFYKHEMEKIINAVKRRLDNEREI